MSSDFQHITTIHCPRTARRCWWCNDPLAPKKPCIKVAGCWEGDFSVIHLHEDCADAWTRDPCSADGEACRYEHERGKTCADAQTEPLARW